MFGADRERWVGGAKVGVVADEGDDGGEGA